MGDEEYGTYILIFTEKAIHVFEGPICGFGVEEVNNGNERSVKYRPDDVEFPLSLDSVRGSELGLGYVYYL